MTMGKETGMTDMLYRLYFTHSAMRTLGKFTPIYMPRPPILPFLWVMVPFFIIHIRLRLFIKPVKYMMKLLKCGMESRCSVSKPTVADIPLCFDILMTC